MAPTSFQNPRTVCVMDASGYLGLHLVQKLLQRGYNVHAAVQKEVKSNALVCLTAENKNLRIFGSDPLDYQSIINAIKGCSCLFYMFEPPTEQSCYDEFMAEIEVRAAHNVLEACAQTESIEKVVFTSSITAVVWRDNRKLMADFDERNWSEANFCRNFKLWHALAKTLSEKTAWALAMDRGVNMVSINAGLLTHPGLSISHPYMEGAAEMYEDGVFATVDIKFLVDTQICVSEDQSTYGRYICFNQLINRPEDAVKLAQMLTPFSPPQSCEDSRIFQQRISNKKLNKLMVDFEDSHRMEEYSG